MVIHGTRAEKRARFKGPISRQRATALTDVDCILEDLLWVGRYLLRSLLLAVAPIARVRRRVRGRVFVSVPRVILGRGVPIRPCPLRFLGRSVVEVSVTGLGFDRLSPDTAFCGFFRKQAEEPILILFLCFRLINLLLQLCERLFHRLVAERFETRASQRVSRQRPCPYNSTGKGAKSQSLL